MKIAVLVYRLDGPACAELVWLDGSAGRVLKSLPVPFYSNIGVVPEHDCLLVAYTEYPEDSPSREWLDVYGLSDWKLKAHLETDSRAHFNVTSWSTFISYPQEPLVYVYNSRTLGHHLAEDYISVLNLSSLQFEPGNFTLPDCVAGWSASGGSAVAQMLFVADGLTVGRLPSDLDQKVAFWLGPEEGMGPYLSIGPRPRMHSELGHARAILFAPGKQLSVVVNTDGTVHLIDPIAFRYLERQQVVCPRGFGMPVFAAQIDPCGRFLYVGLSLERARSIGVTERIAVHDLERGKKISELVLDEPLIHFALSADGDWLCGAGVESGRVHLINSHSGKIESTTLVPGSAQYLIPSH